VDYWNGGSCRLPAGTQKYPHGYYRYLDSFPGADGHKRLWVINKKRGGAEGRGGRIEYRDPVITHTKKGTSGKSYEGDWIDGVIGSQGLSGAADSTILLRRGSRQAELLTTGRDITEQEMILALDLDCGGWTIEGDKKDIQESELRQSIVDWLKENGPHTPAQITRGINEESEKTRTSSTIKTTLARMVEAGILQRDNGNYSVITGRTETLPNVTVTERENGVENSTVSNGQPGTIPSDVPDGIDPEEYRGCYNTAYSVFINKGLPPDEADRKAREEIRKFVAGHNPPGSGAVVSPPAYTEAEPPPLATPDEEIDF
jgi:hypothetical protein